MTPREGGRRLQTKTNAATAASATGGGTSRLSWKWADGFLRRWSTRSSIFLWTKGGPAFDPTCKDLHTVLGLCSIHGGRYSCLPATPLYSSISVSRFLRFRLVQENQDSLGIERRTSVQPLQGFEGVLVSSGQ